MAASVCSSWTSSGAGSPPGLDYSTRLKGNRVQGVCADLNMIVGYRDSRTADFAAGKRIKAFSRIERLARLKLDRLEAATGLKDLAALPGNRFEALKGDRKGQYSVRINDQWRVCFEWPDRSPGPV